MHGLKRPEPTQVEWGLQLGLAEADHLRSVVLQEIVDDLLFGLLIKSSDIEGNEFELFPFRSHFREIAVDMLSVPVWSIVSPVLSVVCSTPSVILFLLLGLSLRRGALGWGLLSGIGSTGNIISHPVFLFRGSSPRGIILFGLVHHFLWFLQV